MPMDWWLASLSTLYLLAALGHKRNPDVTDNPTTVSADASGSMIWVNKATDMMKCHQQAKEVEEVNVKKSKQEEKMLSAKDLWNRHSFDKK